MSGKVNRGDYIAAAVREYLKQNNMTQAKLTGSLLADIANRALDHLDRLAAKQKRLATEEDWILELEKEPHLAGVNVRKELAAAQFWCKNNARVCTRKMFVNWLNNAGKSAVISAGGAKPSLKADGASRDVYVEPKGWKTSAAAQKACYNGLNDEEWKIATERGWFELSTNERAQILKAL